MKTIIKPGKKTYKTTCEQCGCEFTYQDVDKIHQEVSNLKGYYQDYVECPCCHQMIFLEGTK